MTMPVPSLRCIQPELSLHRPRFSVDQTGCGQRDSFQTLSTPPASRSCALSLGVIANGFKFGLISLVRSCFETIPFPSVLECDKVLYNTHHGPVRSTHHRRSPLSEI